MEHKVCVGVPVGVLQQEGDLVFVAYEREHDSCCVEALQAWEWHFEFTISELVLLFLLLGKDLSQLELPLLYSLQPFFLYPLLFFFLSLLMFAFLGSLRPLWAVIRRWPPERRGFRSRIVLDGFQRPGAHVHLTWTRGVLR